MRNGSKKILIIVIIVIAILAIIGGVLAFLVISTDTFKSDKELFGKYFSQNVEDFNQIIESKTYTTYQNLKNANKYETNTDIGMKYSVGGEISSPFNDLSFKFKTQKENDYLYKDAQILFQDEEQLEIEAIKEEEIYGIRFTDVLKQFVSVRNSEEIMQKPNNLDLDPELLQNIISVIDGDYNVEEQVITKEEAKTLKEKYTKIIIDGIQTATYSSQKKSMITVNGSTVKVNLYTLNLSSDQVQNLIVQILNNIKVDDIIINKLEKYEQIDTEKFVEQIDEIIENLGIDQKIPAIKITVYEQNGTTVRTTIDTELEKITIENSKQENKNIVKVQRTILNEEQEKQQNIEISKAVTDDSESYNIQLQVIEGEDNYTITTDLTTKFGNKIETKFTSRYQKEITNIEIIATSITDTTKIGDKIELDEKNNVILNDVDEAIRKKAINAVTKSVPERIKAKVGTLLEKLEITQLIEQIINNNQEPNETPNTAENPDDDEAQMSRIEINKFNAKFEFYTGNSVSSENVKTLLDEVKNNLASVEIIPEQTTTEDSNNTDTKETIKLNIEKDKENLELANGILEKIKDNKKYDVKISYDSNETIKYITIKEAEK